MTGVESAALGLATGAVESAGNMAFGLMGQKMQLKGQKKALEQQNAANYDYWLKTNYNAQVEQLKKAGLNPGLLYGMGGSGGQSGGASAMPSAPNSGGINAATNAQLALMKAQKENIEADTANKLNQNPKGIQETEALKISNAINEVERDIRKSTQLEEYGARANELEARKYVADNIVKMGENGVLELRSMEELENVLLQNAKSREDRRKVTKEIDLLEKSIEGKDLENKILKLEEELQRKTGLDKNSPYFIKALGRLILKIIE